MTIAFSNHLKRLFLGIVFAFFTIPLFAQVTHTDSIKLDYSKIYGYAMQADVKPALAMLKYDHSKKISAKDSLFIKDFTNRFAYKKDKGDDTSWRKSPIADLLSIYLPYWRASLEDTAAKNTTKLFKGLTDLLSARYPLKNNGKIWPEDTIDLYLTKYLTSRGFYSTGLNKVGRLYDMQVWKTQKDTVYEFTIQQETLKVPVIFMTDFLTLGWEQYASLGKYYPGGWSKPEGLYCVRQAYDLKSDLFLIEFLAHEGRHYQDQKLFPKLKGADLEYRAKLVELSLSKKLLFELIQYFINESNHQDYQNSHPFADYCMIRDLSRILFKVEFEKDMTKWNSISVSEINKAAEDLLTENTAELKELGPTVETYIK